MNVPRVGSQGALDVEGGHLWRSFVDAEALYEAWGPPPGSPWLPYHCVTLFAAVERTRGPNPTAAGIVAQLIAFQGEAPLLADPPLEAPGWLDDRTLTVLELPGMVSVAAGAGLATLGCQLVSTFDNWPHPMGLLKPEDVLGQLLYYAPRVHAARGLLTPTSPPVWLCDADRLGSRSPVPRDFDNRYYLDDSLLPGTLILKAHGIERIVLVVARVNDRPAPDVEAWLADRAKDGLEILRVALRDPDQDARAYAPARPRMPNVGMRSDAGGFGRLVPEPSQSSGG